MLRMEPVELSRFLACENVICGICGDANVPDAMLWYLDLNRCRRFLAELPSREPYRIEVLDTWNMTRQTILTGVSGGQEVVLPGHEWMAVLAVR